MIKYKVIERIYNKITRLICSNFMSISIVKFFSEYGICIFHQSASGKKNNSNLEVYKNKYNGKVCIVLGTAPSINNVDLALISEHYVMALNKAYLLSDKLGRHPDGVVIADPHAAVEYGNEVLKNPINDIFFSYSCFSKINNNEKVNFFDFYKLPRMHQGFFQYDITKPLYQSSTVAHYAIQIANYMGFDKIVLIGVDLSFSKANNHFYKDSLGEQSRALSTSIMRQELMIEGMNFANTATGDKLLFRSGNLSSNNPLPFIDLNEI